MDATLTIAAINTQFNSEWVLIEDPRTDVSLEVQSGKVIAHSKDRDEVYRQAAALKPGRFAIVFTGSMASDAAIVL